MTGNQQQPWLRALIQICPTWALHKPVAGDAAFMFSKSYLLELHRRDLTEELQLNPPPVVDGQELPYATNELIIGLEIPKTDEIPLYWSKDSHRSYGIREAGRAVYVHWPFAAQLLRRAKAASRCACFSRSPILWLRSTCSFSKRPYEK